VPAGAATLALLWWSVATTAPPRRVAPTRPRNYVFFNRERERISEASFLGTPSIEGAELKYTWRELEPERDRYSLGPVLADLAFLERHGKRLFVQLQDVSFDERVNVPDYLREDSTFGGGAARQYEMPGNDESKARFEGWMARRWDPAVRERFARLLRVLGRELDGRIEGLVLPETAAGFRASGKLHPAGFTYERYLDGVEANMIAAREAFPRSHVIQYANFMPGEWLPWEDHGYLRSVYEHAGRNGVGVGGPDLLPHRRGQRNHSYPLIARRASGVLAGVAVQDGNLADRNPATGARVTAKDLLEFARDSLRLDYVFWGTEEPYYSKEVLPLLRGVAGRGAR